MGKFGKIHHKQKPLASTYTYWNPNFQHKFLYNALYLQISMK